MTRVLVTWVLLVPLAVRVHSQEKPFPGNERFEVVRADSAWCGPRVLYFFAQYYGVDCTLETIVKKSNADENGFVSMLDLVEAARCLDLEPKPISCTAEQLLSYQGPAIITVNLGKKNSQEGPTHFVGMVGRRSDGRVAIVDPSLGTEVFFVTESDLASFFQGNAILLKGCAEPFWDRNTILLAACASLLCLLILYVGIWKRLQRREAAPTGGGL